MEPKETNIGRVRGYLATLEKGQLILPSPIIARQLRIRPQAVWNALGDLRRNGEIPHPTLEETRMKRSLAKLHANGNKWPDAEPYAKLGMSPTEGHYGLLFEKGRDLPVATLNEMFSRKRIEARKRQEAGQWQEGELRDLTAEEKTDIKRRNSRYTLPEEVKGRVRLWLSVQSILNQRQLISPVSRIEWMLLLDQVREDVDQNTEAAVTTQSSEELSEEHKDVLASRVVQRVFQNHPLYREYVEVIDILRTQKVKKMPRSLKEWDILSRFLQVRKSAQSGDKKAIERFDADISEFDRSFIEDLTPCFRAISSATPAIHHLSVLLA